MRLVAVLAGFALVSLVAPTPARALERWARQFTFVLRAPGGGRPAMTDARAFVPWLAGVTDTRLARSRAWLPGSRSGGLHWRVTLPESTTRAERDAWLARLRQQRPWEATGWGLQILEDGPVWSSFALSKPEVRSRAREWATTGR